MNISEILKNVVSQKAVPNAVEGKIYNPDIPEPQVYMGDTKTVNNYYTKFKLPNTPMNGTGFTLGLNNNYANARDRNGIQQFSTEGHIDPLNQAIERNSATAPPSNSYTGSEGIVYILPEGTLKSKEEGVSLIRRAHSGYTNYRNRYENLVAASLMKNAVGTLGIGDTLRSGSGVVPKNVPLEISGPPPPYSSASPFVPNPSMTKSYVEFDNLKRTNIRPFLDPEYGPP